MVAYILLFIGGLNLGLMGLFSMDLVGNLLGMDLSKLFNILVGAAAVYVIATHMNDCKVCAKK